MKIIPVILAGGSGTRLWPLSRSLYPKQYIPLLSESSLLQETVIRFQNDTFCEPIIICNEENRFLVKEQLESVNVNPLAIILEPNGKNTAPAVTLAATYIAKNIATDSVMLILSADHYIKYKEKLLQNFSTAIDLCHNNNRLVVFGINPLTPETGYGYIKKGPPIDSQAFQVSQFVEKPDLETAKKYLTSGHYLWNSGMFVFSVETYLNEIKLQQPDIYSACTNSIIHLRKDLDFIRPCASEFQKSPSNSIDYAIMENTTNAVVLPLDNDWSDVGNWDALWKIDDKDINGNVIRTKGNNSVLIDTSDSLFYTDKNKLITSIGIKNLIVVDTNDALLICPMDDAQRVKEVVETLKINNRKEITSHNEVRQPWGKHRELNVGCHYQIEYVMIKPGKIISTQKHNHRAEHWIIVQGIAKIVIDSEVKVLHANESITATNGQFHSIHNIGHEDLIIIEIKTGANIEESDLVRLTDEEK